MTAKSAQWLLVAAIGNVVAWCGVGAQTHPARIAPLEYGSAMFEIPPATESNTTSPRVVELLTEALRANPIVPHRVELVGDLGRCGLPAALPPLISAMSDPAPAVRAEAARAAAELGDAAAIPALKALLADGNSNVRREAIRAGAALNDGLFVITGLKDTDESIFAAACALATNEEHDELIAARLASTSMNARTIGVRALGRRGAVHHASVIAEQLDTTDTPLIVAAIDSLREIKATVYLASVRRFLDHPHPTVRRAAVMSMATLGSPQDQVSIAGQMLDDPDLSVRHAAVDLVVAYPSVELIPRIVPQLGAEHRPLNGAARRALVAAAVAPMQLAIDFAVSLLDDPDPKRREDGSFILGRARTEAGLERHIQLLKDPDWGVVHQAAESLGYIGSTNATTALAALVNVTKDQSDLRSIDSTKARAIGAAFIACARLDFQPALATARPYIPDKMNCPIEIRGPAIWAAGVLGDPEDRALADAFLSVARDTSPFETEDARFEAIKAIGNQGHLTILDAMRQEGAQNPIPRLRWMAHTVADRMAGGESSYIPPSMPAVAQTSLQDKTP